VARIWVHDLWILQWLIKTIDFPHGSNTTKSLVTIFTRNMWRSPGFQSFNPQLYHFVSLFPTVLEPIHPVLQPAGFRFPGFPGFQGSVPIFPADTKHRTTPGTKEGNPTVTAVGNFPWQLGQPKPVEMEPTQKSV
jgi:hypothetical protein